MDTQCVNFSVEIEGSQLTSSMDVIGRSWLARWPQPWAELHGVVAAINQIVPEGSSPSHHDRITVLSGKHKKNVSGELFTHSGLEAGVSLTFECVAVGHGVIA